MRLVGDEARRQWVEPNVCLRSTRLLTRARARLAVGKAAAGAPRNGMMPAFHRQRSTCPSRTDRTTPW